MKRQIFALVLGSALSGTAGAGSEQLSQNAALRYWRVWAIAQPQSIQTLQEVKFDEVLKPDWKPTAETTAAVGAFNLPLFMKAAAMPECDFGSDAETEGPMTLLPHLGPMRASVKALMIDARRCVMEHDIDGAVERIAAGYRAAAHVSAEPLLISALVGRACFVMTDQTAQHITDHITLTDTQRASIRDALARFDAEDPLHILSGVKTEHRAFIAWLRQMIEQGRGAQLEQMLVEVGLPDDARAKARQWIDDAKSANEQLAQMDQYYTLCEEVWKQPDADTALKNLADQADKGAFGEVAKFFAPPLSSAHRQYVESRAQYKAALERVTP